MFDKIKYISIIMALVIGLMACNKNETVQTDQNNGLSDNSLIIAMTNEPDSFDPFIAESADTRSILFNIYEGLVKPTTEGGFIPAVAENYEITDDAKTYTFILRDGIQFHDGNLVTIGDVIYSINHAIAQEKDGYGSIDSVEKIDEKTVVIRLNDSDNEFLPYLTTAIVPENYTDLATNPIGTGPYKLESFAAQQSLVLVKNESYWQEGIPHLEKVTFKSAANSAGALLELKSGTVDMLSVEFPVIQDLDPEEFSIVETSSNSVQLLALNNQYEPLQDVRIRQAISYVVDAQEIIETINQGYAVRSGSPILPAFTKLYDTSLDNAYIKDIDKAKQLMKEAGYESGFDITISAPSNYQVHVNTAQLIVNQLAQIGINAAIDVVDWSTWLSDVYIGRQFEATIVSIDGANVTAKSYLDRYVSGAENNFINFASDAYDEVYNMAVNESDELKRNDLYKQAQQILSNEAASVFIQDISRLYAFKKGFTGIVNYPLYVLDLSTIRRTD